MNVGKSKKSIILLIITIIWSFGGCSKSEVNSQIDSIIEDPYPTQIEDINNKNNQENLEECSNESEVSMVEMNWGSYFNNIDGTAVFYSTGDNRYSIYNMDIAKSRFSPCSTFKIVSSLIGLEKGVILPENSIRTWNGDVYWNDKWNKDLEFKEAFESSCVWYFKEVIDELGEEEIKTTLENLNYGNCDISDWEGIENSPNKSRELRGFWLESSLEISALEQVEVLKRIFYENNEFQEETIENLLDAMEIEQLSRGNNKIYGKTGFGKRADNKVDCWFTGFIDQPNERIFFCIYLGDSSDANITTDNAKNIVLQILENEY